MGCGAMALGRASIGEGLINWRRRGFSRSKVDIKTWNGLIYSMFQASQMHWRHRLGN